VLVYCRISVTAVNPNTPLDGTSVRTRGPAEELRYRLDRAVEGSTAGLPTMDELTTPQNFDLVESWRRAAQASALSEHDFPAGLSWGTLTDQQCRTVLNDAAEITQGLVVLDQRHTNIPGWAALPDCAALGRAAQVCAVFAGYDGQDHTVDLHGWRPTLETIDGPDPGGFAGVIQTEQNLLEPAVPHTDLRAHPPLVADGADRLAARASAAAVLAAITAALLEWSQSDDGNIGAAVEGALAALEGSDG
jgi:hypothetical protein